MDFFINNYILIWICIIGLCLGSFFNVVILRSLSGESIVYPPSKCPKCGNKLKPWHNIPVLSYLFLRGKCAFCKEKISVQYPIIEIVTMGLWAICYLKFGLSIKAGFIALVLSSLLIMSVTDIKEKLVDCNIAIALAFVGVLYNWLSLGDLLNSILGLLLGVFVMELFARSTFLMGKGRAFGEADTYVAGALGACFGLVGLLQILLYTMIASMLFILPIFLHKLYKNNQKITFLLLIFFIINVLVYKTVSQNICALFLILILGIFLVINILRSLKVESDPSYLPLVPAFMLAVLYFLFI